jgi:hypothetical protein
VPPGPVCAVGDDAVVATAPAAPLLMESSILVPVPEAELVVGHLRRPLDRSALRRVPAHVTVLFLFVPPDAITGTVMGSAAFRAAETEVRPALPVRTLVRCAWLMTGTQTPANWHTIAHLPLGT